MTVLAGGGVYALLDLDSIAPDRALFMARDVLAAGIGLLQLRDKRRRTDAAWRTKLGESCRAHRVPLLINDDLSAARQADGIHLGLGDTPIAEARKTLGPDALIGATCHASLDHAARAADQGADYLSFGRFFDSHTKPHAPPADPAVLTRARARFARPIVAIGGINPDNGGELVAAGAQWLCVGHALFASADPAATVRQLRALFPID